ncbi:MAG: NACHT domain-containing protein [Cyanobacteria bacterium J06629_19]
MGNRRVSKAVRTAAETNEVYDAISCYTFDELLDEDADFDKYLDWLEEQIKAKGVDVGYLPLACRKDDLDPVTQQKMGVSTYGEADGWIDGYVEMWLDDPAKEHLSVLGEFGTGKTWFSLHYAWVAMQRYREAKRKGTERPRVPIVVSLRDYAKAVTVRSLFSEFFFDKHEMLRSYSVFEKLNRMGKLLLIFDGFDEMAARVNRQSMIDNFWELAKVVVPGAKAILTCRTEHFPDAIEGRKLLNAELKASLASQTGEPPQFEVLELEKFSDEQIAELMGRKAGAETVEKVMGNSQLLDLARRPVMVDLISQALPDIEAGKPIDMARVYLYAVTRKMDKDIRNDRTFTSLADKLYFLCELSWEMLSSDRMSLNYLDFPERLQQMFAARVQEEKDLDHWRYDMMGQTILIRNSEGDYSPAHRSLLEFFVAYKIVASLGAMHADFMPVAQQQSHVMASAPGEDYSWDGYFKRECADDGTPVEIAPLNRFVGIGFDELLPLIGNATLAKAVLDLAHPMLDDATMREQLLPVLQATAQKTLQESGYLGGNVAQLMLAKTSHALIDSDLSRAKLQGVDFTKTFLRRVNLQGAWLAEAPFSKVLSSVYSVAYSPDNKHLAIGDGKGILQVWEITTGQVMLFCSGHSAAIQSVAYSPDGHQLVSCSGDKTVKLWNPLTGDCTCTLQGHEGLVELVAYSPDGHQLASCSGNTTVKLWNPSTGDCTRTLQGHELRVLSVAYSPDGQQLATGSDDNTVRIWDANTGECLRVIDDHVCAGLNITGTVGLSSGQRTALKLMGAVDHDDE